MSNKKKHGALRVAGLAAVSLGAAAALAFGGVSAATAASGRTNQGVSDPKIVADAPAQNFATPGTTGTLTYTATDGTTPGSALIKAGDVMTYSYGVPAGLEFPADICDSVGTSTPTTTVTCTLGPERRGLVITQTATVDFTQDNTDFSGAERSFPVVSTGEEITERAAITFSPWTGLTTQTPHVEFDVTNEVVEVPLVLGGVIGAAGLGAGALLVARRRGGLS